MIGPGDPVQVRLSDGGLGWNDVVMTYEDFVTWVDENFRCTTQLAHDTPSSFSDTACQSPTQSTTSLDQSDRSLSIFSHRNRSSTPFTVAENEAEEGGVVKNDIAQPRALVSFIDAPCPELVPAMIVDPIVRPKRPINPPMCGAGLQEYFCVHENGRRCPLNASFRRKKSTYVEHLNSLSGVYRYKCEHCGTRFNRSNNLKRHGDTCPELHPKPSKQKKRTGQKGLAMNSTSPVPSPSL
ncbi:hypothetical protein FRB96_004454 [Tulasnella sp. 330]|nr:hypothetical protein FRB96_004454 [Tulasnella sp. 330]